MDHQAAAAVRRVQLGLQCAGPAATQVGAPGQCGGMTPRQRGKQAAQWIAERACWEDGRTEVSQGQRKAKGQEGEDERSILEDNIRPQNSVVDDDTPTTYGSVECAYHRYEFR